MNPESIPLSKLTDHFSRSFDALLFSVSYESRSSIIWNLLTKQVHTCIAFHNKNHNYISDRLSDVTNQLSNCITVPLDTDNPLASFDSIRLQLCDFFSRDNPKRIAIDVTCFTRESLAMLIRIVKHVASSKCKITCLYLKAGDYIVAKVDNDHDEWLTRGIADVRTILGYRGHVSIRAKTHLIVLPGFEVERAQGVIEYVQPDRLSIGAVSYGEDVRPEFAERLSKMVSKLKAHYQDGLISCVSFSARNPYLTCKTILEAARPDENTIVTCLNTKLAMVGTCLAAIENPFIQLVYAQPIDYNVTNYASPGDEISCFELR